MAGPWERYQAPAQAAGPWTKFQPAPTAQAVTAAAPSFADLPVPVPEYDDPVVAAAMAPPERNALVDLAGQGATGGVEGLGSMVDLPANMHLLASQGAAALWNNTAGKLGAPEVNMPQRSIMGHPGKAIVEGLDGAGVLADDPEGLMEIIFRRTGQELGAAAIPVVGTASLAAKPAAAAMRELGVATGSGAGAGLAQSAFGEDNVVADMAGQVLGAGVAGAVGNLPRLITPNPIRDPQLAKAGETLAKEGVELTAGQRTGNKGLQYAESELGGEAAANFTDAQAEQFTRATLKRAGVVGDRATPEVMDAAFTRIGQDFDALVAQSTMPLDQQLATDLLQTLDDYNNFVPGGMQAPVVKSVVDGLSQNLSTAGMLDGPTYQAYRSQIDRAARGAVANPYLQEALYGIRNAMDSAVERGLAQTNPEAVDMWRQARTEYRNLLVIEKAASRAGENAALGLISPQNLRNAVQQQGQRSYVRGQGDFAELARAGNVAMPQLPNSGTAPRLAARTFAQLPVGLGAGAYLATGGDGGAAAMSALGGAAAPLVANKVGEKVVMNPVVQKYLGNQLVKGGGPALTFDEWLSNFTGPAAGAYGQTQIGSRDGEVMDAIYR